MQVSLMWRVSNNADPDQTRRRRRGGWSWSSLFACVRTSLFAWRWPYVISCIVSSAKITFICNRSRISQHINIYGCTMHYTKDNIYQKLSAGFVVCYKTNRELVIVEVIWTYFNLVTSKTKQWQDTFVHLIIKQHRWWNHSSLMQIYSINMNITVHVSNYTVLVLKRYDRISYLKNWK